MADTDIEQDITQRGRAQGVAGSSLGTPVNYTSTTALRTRLAAINAGYFTASKLNSMTKNDMDYAVRLADDPTTI